MYTSKNKGGFELGEVIWTKEYKLERYRKLNETALCGQIVCAGSSLMEMFPIEKFVKEDKPDLILYNRGIGGFVTKELIDNIDVCILDLKPSKLFINIGTNDLGDPDVTIEEIMNNYSRILCTVKKSLPNTKIFVMAYYPVNYDAATEEIKPCLLIRTNEKICQANNAVKKLAAELNVQYIDICEPLFDEQKRLKAEYTIEGMHINEEGYRAIYPLFAKYLD